MTRSFVEVSFRNEVGRTGIGMGPHPHWNEEISIPFKYVIHCINFFIVNGLFIGHLIMTSVPSNYTRFLMN